MLVDVFFLGVVHADEGFDRFDNTLCVADQIPVGVLGLKTVGQSPQQPRQVQDLTVGAAHGGEAMPIMQEFRETRIDTTFIVAFMLDNMLANEPGGFSDQADSCFRGSIIQRISDLPQAIERRIEGLMFLMQCPCGGGLHGFTSEAPSRC